MRCAPSSGAGLVALSVLISLYFCLSVYFDFYFCLYFYLYLRDALSQADRWAQEGLSSGLDSEHRKDGTVLNSGPVFLEMCDFLLQFDAIMKRMQYDGRGRGGVGAWREMLLSPQRPRPLLASSPRVHRD